MREGMLREAFNTLRVGFKYGAFAYIAYCGWQSVSALAGKTTGADLDLVVRAAIEIGKEDWPPWAIAGFMAIWAVSERRLRQWRTASLATRNVELERRLDSLREGNAMPASDNRREGNRP